MHIRSLILAAICMLIGATSTLAREWTDSTGKNKIDAEYLDFHDGSVRLKAPTGRVLTVPLENLSTDDQLYALQEKRRREAIVPELGPEGKKHSSELLQAVRTACAPFAGKADLDRRELQAALEGAHEQFLAHSSRIIETEGTRAAVTPVIIVLLRDMNVAVRAAGIRAIQEVGDSASAALPALAQLLNDDSEQIRRLATSTLVEASSSTDTAAPALAKLIGTSDAELVKRASECLLQIGVPGPRIVESIPVLTSQLDDRNRSPELRVISASALGRLLSRCGNRDSYRGAYLTPEMQFMYRQPELRELLESPDAIQQLSGIDPAFLSESCRKLVPFLSDQDAQIRTKVLEILASTSPEMLVELPDESFARLLLESEPTADDDFYVDDSLIGSLLQLSHEGRMPLKLTPPDAVKLLAKGSRSYREFATLQLQMMGSKARAALPELAKLTAHNDANVRAMVLNMLVSPLFSRGDDLSQMPAMQVTLTASAQGGIQRIEAEGKAVADLAALQAAITAHEPARAASAFDVDAILKGALADTEEEVRYVAMEALARRGTAAAKAALAETARKAVDRDTRETARHFLEEAERRSGRDYGDDPAFAPDDDPFGTKEPEAEPKPSREMAVVLMVDPTIELEHLAPALAAIVSSQVSGIRLRGTEAHPAEIQLQHDGAMGAEFRRSGYYGEQSFALRLTRAGGDAAATLSIRGAGSEEEWMRVPSHEALQFMLSFILTPYRRQLQSMHRDYDDFGGLGRGAIPFVVNLHADKSARYADLVALLNAVGTSSDGQAGPRELLQWINLAVGDKPGTLWFARIAELNEGADE